METKEKATHTPTPWTLDVRRNGVTYVLLDSLGNEIAEILLRDDAKFIVRAVNAHEVMLEALKEARSVAQCSPEALATINAAIAQAEVRP